MKFITVEGYQPKDYSYDDFLRYQCMQNDSSHSDISTASVSSRKASYAAFSQQKNAHILRSYEQRLTSLTRHLDRGFLPKIMSIAHQSLKSKDVGHLREQINQYAESPQCTQTSTQDDDLFILLHEMLKTVELMINLNDPSFNNDPKELSPVNKSIQNLNAGWNRVVRAGSLNLFAESKDAIKAHFERQGSTYGLDPKIVAAHIANIEMVLSPRYEEQVAKAFAPQTNPLQSPPHRVASNARSAGTRFVPNSSRSAGGRPNPGFLLALYQDPKFQSGYTQLLLLAIIITAALVAAAFLVNVAVLPTAVATVVTGLSKLAANMIFGTAVMFAAGATVALAASLHGRFFNRADNLGGGGPAGSTSDFNPTNR